MLFVFSFIAPLSYRMPVWEFLASFYFYYNGELPSHLQASFLRDKPSLSLQMKRWLQFGFLMITQETDVMFLDSG